MNIAHIFARVGSAIKTFGVVVERKFMNAAEGSIAAIIGASGSWLRRNSAESDPIGAFAGWVYFAMDRIADATTRANLQLYQITNKSGDVEQVEDSPLLALLDRPNPAMTRSRFFYTLAVYVKMFGEAPFWIQRQGKQIVAIWPLRPDLLSKNGSVWRYAAPGGRVLEYQEEDVVLAMKPNPDGHGRGFGALQACALEVDVDAAAALWNKYFMENYGRPEVVLETEQGLSQEAYDRLIAAWNSRYAGPTNAGKPAILENGLKARALDNSPKEAGYMETRNFSRDIILGILGIPESMFSKDSTYANSESGRREFAEFTVDPIVRMIVEAINVRLVPEYGDMLWLTYDGIVRDDDSKKLELAKTATNVFMTVNEVRYLYNLPPIVGGDVIYMSIAMQPTIGEGKSVGAKTITLSGLKTTQSPRLQEIKRLILARSYHRRKLVAGVKSIISAKFSDKREVKSIIVRDAELESKTDIPEHILTERKEYLLRTESREKVYEKALRKLFTDQEVAVRKRIESLGVPKATKAADDWLDAATEDVDESALIKVVRGQALIDIKNGITAIAAMLGADAVDVTGSAAVTAYIRKTAADMAKNVTDTTREELRRALAEGVVANETQEEIADRVASVFDTARDSRSQTIARTEVGRAENFARLEEMKALGASKRMWLAVFRNTRPDHAAADGQTVGIAEKFEVGGNKCDYPHDPSLPADQTINCQCSVSPIVD